MRLTRLTIVVDVRQIRPARNEINYLDFRGFSRPKLPPLPTRGNGLFLRWKEEIDRNGAKQSLFDMGVWRHLQIYLVGS